MNSIVRCPNCGSENYYTEKRGFSWLYAAIGFLFLSLFGLMCGFIGKDNLVFH